MNLTMTMTSGESKGRILIVTSTYPLWEKDTTPTFVHDLAKRLFHDGWIVDVLAPHAPGAKLSGVLDNIHVTRFRYSWPVNTQTLCYMGGALINLRKNHWNLLKVPLFVISQAFAVFRALLKHDYDILHTHWIVPQGFVGVLASFLFRTKHVTTIHGGDLFSLDNRVINTFKRFTLANVDAITANSTVTFELARKLYQGSTKSRIIPMGVNTTPLIDNGQVSRIIQKYKRRNAPLVLFVGRVIEEKGVGDLICATRELLSEFPDIVTLIVGDGQDLSKYKKLTIDLNLTDNVYFTGWVESSDVPAYMMAADMLIGPSIVHDSGWREAQGLVFLEAMTVGTPVIATDVGGNSDFLIHEKTGLVIGSKDPSSITSSVIKLTSRPDLRQAIIHEAQKIVIERYSQDKSARSFNSLFNELLH